MTIDMLSWICNITEFIFAARYGLSSASRRDHRRDATRKKTPRASLYKKKRGLNQRIPCCAAINCCANCSREDRETHDSAPHLHSSPSKNFVP